MIARYEGQLWPKHGHQRLVGGGVHCPCFDSGLAEGGNKLSAQAPAGVQKQFLYLGSVVYRGETQRPSTQEIQQRCMKWSTKLELRLYQTL